VRRDQRRRGPINLIGYATTIWWAPTRRDPTSAAVLLVVALSRCRVARSSLTELAPRQIEPAT
jgi:hypothetical protein